MKFLLTYKLFEDNNLKIGDNTDAGIITDITDTQVEINGNWFAKKIVKKINKPPKLKKLHNRGRINPNMVISAFSNHIDSVKLDNYSKEMGEYKLSHNFPPILGYPTIIDESDVGKKFLCGNEITKDYINKYAWVVTDGHHRTLSAIRNDLPYLETELDYSYIEDDYYTEKLNEDNSEYISREVLKNPFIEGIEPKILIRDIKKWLSNHVDIYSLDKVRFYHSTSKNLDILKQGLLPTSKNRRRSFQSTSGYVYLATTPERAKIYGDLGNQSDSVIYCVDIFPHELKADLDDLRNNNQKDLSLANSIAHGNVRVKGKIPIYNISLYDEKLKKCRK